MQIFATIIVIIGFAGLFLLVGRGLLALIFTDFKAFPSAMQNGFGYFLGMAGFLAFWRILESVISSASHSFWLTLVLMVLLCLYFIKARILVMERPNFPRLFYGTAWFIFVVIFELVLWLQVLPTPRDPFDNFGSAHPVRYTNIAEYIFTANDIPVLNQNFAQSMLAVVPRFFGAAVPFLALNWWLSISIFALTLSFFGLFRYWGLKKSRAVFAVFLFMMSNTALSFTHVLSLDSNNPFLMSSYTDATAGIATFFIFLLLLLEFNKTPPQVTRKWYLIPAILGIYWNFSGGQNILLGIFLVALLCLWQLIKNKSLKHKFIHLAFIFGMASILGMTQGGMLTPKYFREKVSIPGLAAVSREGEYSGIKPELPFAVGFGRDWEYGNPYDPAEKNIYVQILRGGGNISGSIIHKIIWRLETNFWTSLRVMFFPLLGLIIFGSMRRAFNSDLHRLWGYALAIFSVGFFLAFSIIISGRKWEMSRFMILPYALGLIFFILWFDFIRQKISSSAKAKVFSILVAVIMTVGPTVNAFAIIHRNFKNPELTKKKFSFFLKNPGTYGQEIWQEWIEKGLVKE